MNDEAIKQATGRRIADWFSTIRDSGEAGASHKEIADFLHESHQVSYWWAQEITVEYEKHIGRRVVGQTQDGLFQIGVSKTISTPAEEVWKRLQSPGGIGLITSAPGKIADPAAAADGRPSTPAGLKELESLNGESRSGVKVSTTTFQAGSHLRLQWQRAGWPSHSILQIRITPKSESKSTLSFHQEKLPTREDRRVLQEHWKRVAALFAEAPAQPS